MNTARSRSPEISPAEAVAATNRHYDLPPEVFATFLDPTMKYTCGLYHNPHDTLDQAQQTKLHYITRLLHITGGEHVLDIGCGWGSLTLHLAKHHHCHVTAITPSPTQAGHIRAKARAMGVDDHVRVRIGYFPQLAPRDDAFDAVAMVGVIEHMPDHDTALRTARDLLRPSGRLYLSASCYRSQAHQEDAEYRPASRHAVSVFGYTAMVALSALTSSMESAGFSISSLLDLTAHYHRTIAEWQRRISASRDRMEALVPGFAEQIGRYFDTANASWGYTAKHYALSAVRSRMGETELHRSLRGDDAGAGD